jgi:hypothetical protein
MKKLLLLTILGGFILKPPDIFAQTTHYTGLAKTAIMQTSFPPECGINGGESELDSLTYTVFHRKSLPDSITFTVFIKASPNTQSVIPSDTFYTKNDGDSIVFPFMFHTIDHYQGSEPSCQSYYIETLSNGIARISTATAGVLLDQINKNIEFYPNPTIDLLKFNYTAKKATVFDNLGRIMLSKNWNDNEAEITLDVSALTSGCYTILLENEKDRSIGKFIKY